MSGSRKRHAIAQPGWDAKRRELARQERLKRDPEGQRLIAERSALFASFSETGESPSLAELRDIQYRIEKRLNELEVMCDKIAQKGGYPQDLGPVSRETGVFWRKRPMPMSYEEEVEIGANMNAAIEKALREYGVQHEDKAELTGAIAQGVLVQLDQAGFLIVKKG